MPEREVASLALSDDIDTDRSSEVSPSFAAASRFSHARRDARTLKEVQQTLVLTAASQQKRFTFFSNC
ncbi:hypothetical protein D3C81_70030 [compost metagenome]